MSKIVISRAAVAQSPHRMRIESGAFLPDAFFASNGRMCRRENQDIELEHPEERVLANLLNSNEVFIGMVLGTARIGETYLIPGIPNDRRDTNVQHIPAELTRGDRITVPPADALEPGQERGPAPIENGVGPITRNYESLQVAEPDDTYQIRIAALFNSEISALARNINGMQKEFNDLFSKLIKIKRKIEIALAPLNDNPAIAQLIESIMATRRHAKVENAFINDNSIIVKTKTIVTIPVNGNRRLIGKIMIVLPMNMFVGESPVIAGVKIYNLTHVINDSGRVWQAPHVIEDGSSCFGSTMQILFDAIVAKDVSLITSAVIQFLEQPNVGDSYGRCAALLPVVMETNE